MAHNPTLAKRSSTRSLSTRPQTAVEKAVAEEPELLLARNMW